MKEDPDRLSHGIDFLDIKNGLLAEYNINLAYLVMKKTRGELIEGDKVVERLCYLRTMLEKIRPIEHKLKFQIDKYVNLAETGLTTPRGSRPTQVCFPASLVKERMRVTMMR